MNEHQEQVALLKWLKVFHPKAYSLTYATPNAGKRTPRQGAYLKAEGLRAGVPDLCIAYPCGEYHGLYIEYKTLKGKASLVQVEWLDNLSEAGYCAVLCKGLDAAIETITAYLDQS